MSDYNDHLIRWIDRELEHIHPSKGLRQLVIDVMASAGAMALTAVEGYRIEMTRHLGAFNEYETIVIWHANGRFISANRSRTHAMGGKVKTLAAVREWIGEATDE
jgi:hypothetical protein